MYLVTIDGAFDYGFGAEIYAIGLFSSMENAMNAKEATLDQYPEALGSIEITELEVDKIYPIRKDEDKYNDINIVTDKYLGGYCE